MTRTGKTGASSPLQQALPFGQGVTQPTSFSFVEIEELDKRLQKWVERENEQSRAYAVALANNFKDQVELSKIDTEADEVETVFSDFLDDYLKNDKPATRFIKDWDTYYKTNFE